MPARNAYTSDEIEACFVHRQRDLEGDDGNPMNEVRVVADSLVGNARPLRVEAPIGWAAGRTVLGFAVGDDVESGG